MPETEGLEPTSPNAGQVPTETPTLTETPDAEKSGIDSLPDWAKDQIKKLRSESASHRTKLSAFERAEEERQAASLTELGKAQQAAVSAGERATALEAKLAKRDALSALKSAGVIDPDLALFAIQGQIEITDGEPTNVEALVADFIKQRPQMVAQAAPQIPDTKSTNPSSASTAPPLKPEQVGRLVSSRARH